MEALLKYIYTGSHESERDNDWAFQLEVLNVANKYLSQVLADAAFIKFRLHVCKPAATQAIFEAITHIREHTDHEGALQMADKLQEDHILALLKLRDFRESIEQDTDLMWKYMDSLRRFKSSLQECWITRCEVCLKATFLVADPLKNGALNKRIHEDCAGCLEADRDQLWVPKKRVKRFQERLGYVREQD